MANRERINPFGELARFDPFRQFDDAFKLPRSLLPGMPEEPQIKMDVSEDDKTFYVKAEIPGVQEDTLRSRSDGGRVSISAGVRKEREAKRGETVIRSERCYGSQVAASPWRTRSTRRRRKRSTSTESSS